MSPVARFVVGGLLGYLWERSVAPQLPGALPLPFRPIYGCGAALSTGDFATNCYRSLVLEALAHSQRPSLWSYDTERPETLSAGIKADNMAAFGTAMTAADSLFRAIGI